MIAVNVAALPETLLEAELFGHVKGAFTGASQQRIGRCEQANRSTLFLDEIGDLPLDVQTKLLRFLQEREFQRVGSSETIRVDVRMIVAANVNLLDLVRQGTFREDLYYRLSVVPITVPPLRERPEDIPLLANHFIAKVCLQENIRPAPSGSRDAGQAAGVSLARKRPATGERGGDGHRFQRGPRAAGPVRFHAHRRPRCPAARCSRSPSPTPA